MPSGVFAEPDGGLLTGTKAVNARQLDPGRYVATPKRLLGAGLRSVLLADGPVPVVRMVAAVLADVAARAGQQPGGAGRPGTVLTHPAGWDRDLQQALVAAAGQAGLAGARVLAEPVAAALHLGRGCAPGAHIAVYDLGGGTFDAAVLRRTGPGFEVAATGGQTAIGGEWFDELLRRHLDAGPLGQLAAWRQLNDPGPGQDTDIEAYTAWRNKVELLRENIRFTKEVLSEEKSWGLIIPGHPEGWTVTRETLEDVLRDPLGQTVEVLAATIADAGLASGQLAAIYLVGGASRTPLVRELLAERFPGKVTSHPDDPQTVVALGAAASYHTATNPRDPSPPPPPPPSPPPPRLVRWQNHLTLTPAGPGTSIRLQRYEARAPSRFSIIVRRQAASETFGAFVQAVEQEERQGGMEMAQPRAINVAGATLGLLQHGHGTADGAPMTFTHVYAAFSSFLVNTWTRGTPAAAVEELSVDFRTVGSADQLTLAMAVPPEVRTAMREHFVARVKGRLSNCVLTATTGVLAEGTDTPETAAEHLLAEARRAVPKIRVRASAPDVFLNSRLCVHHLLIVAQRQEHWWTGIVDGRFVRIAVSGAPRRLAERCRDLVSLR